MIRVILGINGNYFPKHIKLSVLVMCVRNWMFMCCLNKLLLQRLVVGLSPRMPVFDPRSVHVGFVVYKVALRKVIFSLLRFSPLSTILPLVNTHFHLHLALTNRSKGQNLGTFQEPVLIRGWNKDTRSAACYENIKFVEIKIWTCHNISTGDWRGWSASHLGRPTPIRVPL